MGIQLNKKTGINLKKGSTISLEKEGKKLENVCVGVNWGAMQPKGFFSKIFNSAESVDLDASAAMFKEDGQLFDCVYYNNLRSKEGSIRHSGDDLTGDYGPDDDIDNEVLTLKLNAVDSRVNQIVFFINSYKSQDFADIPYSKIRIFEGLPKKPESVFATFNLSAEDAFAGKIAMLMGKMTRQSNNDWKFSAIGEPLEVKGIDQTIKQIQKRFLDA
jgi:tellurium resistance protein TerZ